MTGIFLGGGLGGELDMDGVGALRFLLLTTFFPCEVMPGLFGASDRMSLVWVVSI